jgi:hypothetical protein
MDLMKQQSYQILQPQQHQSKGDPYSRNPMLPDIKINS